MADETPLAARNKGLEFLINKTYAAMVECGKAHALAMTSYLVLGLVSVILITGVGGVGTTEVTIPILGLKADHYFAAFIGLLLSAVPLYWFYTCLYTETLLAVKLADLWRERYPLATVGSAAPPFPARLYPFPDDPDARRMWSLTWYMRHPSPFGSQVVTAGGDGFVGRLRIGAQWVVGILTLLIPPILAYVLSGVAKYNTRESVTVVGLTILSIVPAAVALAVSLRDRPGVIAQIEGRDSEDASKGSRVQASRDVASADVAGSED